jgi:integrase
MFHEFIELLLSDIDAVGKLNVFFIGIALSGGLRQGEIFDLRVRDVEIDDGFYIINSSVLKKKDKDARRDIVLYPLFNSLMKEFLKKKKQSDYLVAQWVFLSSRKVWIFRRLNREVIRKAISRKLGKSFSPHTFRHSFVSFLVNYAKYDSLIISKIIQIDLKNVAFYGHIRARFKMTNLYDKKSGRES